MEKILENWVPPIYFNEDPDRFGKITIGVREEDGTIRMDKENPPLPFRLKVLFDRATADLYMIQTPSSLIFKNVLLMTIGIPLHFLGTLVWNIVCIPLELIKTLFLKTHINRVSQCVKNIIAAPKYALGCEIAAFYGLFHPNKGRAIFALIEKEWNHGLPRQQDVIRHGKEVRGESTFFMAYCFQALGSLNSPRFFRAHGSPRGNRVLSAA